MESAGCRCRDRSILCRPFGISRILLIEHDDPASTLHPQSKGVFIRFRDRSPTGKLMKTFLPAMMLAMLAALVISGCSQTPILYVPPPTHLPLFTDAGEADLSFLGGFDGLDLRAAWSPIKHLEVFGLGSWLGERSDSASHAEHLYGELGAGWYSGGAPVTFSVVAGYGWGTATGYGRKFSWNNQSPAYEVTGRYRRPFAALGLGYKALSDSGSHHLHREYGVTIRVAHAGFEDVTGIPGTTRGGGWYVEPVFINRSGSEELQFEIQTGFTSGDYGAGIESADWFGSIGFHLQLDRLF
jgi:hypothetical protein